MESKLVSYLLLLCVFIAFVSSASALGIQSATYTVKEAPLLGNTYKYAIFEAQFDEELYMVDQWPVGCVNGTTVPCPASASQVGPFVDETMYYPDGSVIPISQLSEGVWLNNSIMNTYDSQYLKFNLQYDASRPCPYILIDFQSVVGTMAFYVSTKYIPSPANYIWSHGFYSPQTIAINPAHGDFVYGNYYIQIANQAGRVANIYAIRYRVLNSPTCPALPSVDHSTLPYSRGTWLNDGQLVSYQSSPNPASLHFFYKLYAPGRCSFFSTGVYKNSGVVGESVLLVSANIPNITAASGASIMWSSALTPGDDRVSVNYCNPDPSATYNIFYVSLYVGGATGRFDLVATTQEYQANKAVSQFAFSQVRLDLAFGAFPRLTCDNAIHTCTYFAFKGCEVQGIGCCTIFQPITPTAVAQALWPWNTADISLGNFHTAIPWTDVTPLVPGKVAWSMLMEWTDADDVRHVVTVADPSTCNVTIGNVFVDSQGVPLDNSKPISFDLAPEVCDYERFKQLSAQASDLSAGFQSLEENVHSLALQQLKLAMVTWDPVFEACEDFVEEFVSIPVTQESDNVYLCTHKQGTAAWNTDPCCNPLLKTSLSCRATPVFRDVEGVGSLNNNAINSQCGNPQCSSAEIQAYLEQRSHINSDTQGCMTAFNRQASLDRSDVLLAFTYQCKEKIQGSDLEGSVCATDADCVNGASCNTTFKRCNHTVDDVIDCMANLVDSDTALNLFIGWGIYDKPDVARLKVEFKNRWVQNVCTGPNALKYRKGFHYTLVDPTYPDECTAEGLEPFCVDISKSRSPSCVIPSLCDKTIDASASFRFWQPVYEDNTGCASSKICNWRSESFYPCPDSFVGDCEARCVNASMGSICLDCSQSIHGTCLQVDSITTEARCNQGLCSADASITDEAACAATGICQNVVANCASCSNDAATCEANGLCGDYTDFKTQIDAGNTGVCVKPATWSGTAYSCTSPLKLTTLGCANLTTPSASSCAAWATTGQRWVNFATDNATCTSNAGYGCYSTSSALFFPRNQSECAICNDCVWKPYYSWTQGVWVPGTMQTLIWDTTRYYTAAAVQFAVDYSIVNTDVEAAITKDFSFAYYTDALCRLDGVDSLTNTIVCDCTPGNSGCFTDRSRSAVGSISVCPYQAKQLETLVGNITVSDTAVPVGSECHVVSVSSTAVGKYQVPPDHSVTHALFKKIEKNPYLIVVNDKDGVVGQLISDAATVTFDFTPNDPMILCIPPADFISIDSAATLYTLAKQKTSDNSIVVFDGGIPQNIPAGSSGSVVSVCGTITESGTYFAVAVVPNYKTINPRPSSETIAACCLYLALVVFSFVQLILLLLDRVKQKLLVFKIVAIVIIIINAAIRVLYLLKSDFGKGTESIQFIIFELPTFLYFSVFTVIVYLWIIVVMSTKHFGKKTALDQKSIAVRTVFILVNVFMYAIFVVFIFLIAILPAATKQSPCFLGNLDSAITSVEKSIKIAYWIFQLVICVLLCIGFVVAASGLLHTVIQLRKRDLGRKEAVGKAKKRANAADVQMVIITIVAFVCVVFLLVRSIMFLDAAVNGSTIHVIAFCLLEIVPQTMLMFYIHPFRCFTEAGRSSSTKHSGSGTGKSTYSGMGTRSRSNVPSRAGEDESDEMPSRAGDPSASAELDVVYKKKPTAASNGKAGTANGASNGNGHRHHDDEDSSDEETDSTDDSI